MGKDNENHGAGPEALYVVFTMDCNPVRQHESIAGPQSWERSRTAIESFVQALADEGFLSTLFVTPAVITRNRKAVDRALELDAEAALLCHPQLHGYSAYMGDYPLDRQLEVLKVARAQWTKALGTEPETIRPGFFSGNDYSYQAFLTAGFRQGSCSLPGCIDIEQSAVWTKAFPLPHHTDPLDRYQPGSLDFFEVPVTSDLNRDGIGGLDSYTPAHLRLEDPEIEGRFERLVVSHIDRSREGETEVPTLAFITSNTIAWGRKGDPHVDRMKGLLEQLRGIAEDKRRKLIPATVARLHAEADRRWIEKHGPPDFC